MKATEILINEHLAIKRVLSALERASNRLNRGEDVYLRFFLGTTVFIRNFADNCHHKKEETGLFPALVEYGLPLETGPLAVILAEHEEGRHLSQEIRLATERLQAGDVRARDMVIKSANSYVKLIRQHILKEDNILFPFADKLIPVDRQQQLGEALGVYEIDAMGDNVGEKYFGLAERLEKESIR